MKEKRCKSRWLIFDRILSHDSLRQVLILFGILLVVYCLSFVLLEIFGGNWQKICDKKQINLLLFPLYLLIDDNAFSSVYNCKEIDGKAVFVACLIYIAGVIIFTGMIISVMTNMLGRRVEDYKEGHIHYLISGHYVIMGYDEILPSIITHILEKDKDAYVLILTSYEVVRIREKLQKSFSEKQMNRIIINYGHRVSADAYQKIHLETAEQVYVVGNHELPAHDAVNVECMDSICSYLNKLQSDQRPNRITCFFKDLDTYAAFKTSEIFQEVSKLGIEFMPYNIFTGWANQIFVKQEYRDLNSPASPCKYPCIYGQGISSDDDRYVHLVFVGTTNFAVAFAMEAAHILHFPNAHKAKTRITFIDRNADKEKEEFIIRNRHFFEIQPFYYYDMTEAQDREPEGIRDEYVCFDRCNGNSGFLDVEFEFIKGDVFSKNIQDRITIWATEHGKKQYFSIFLAQADQRQNFVMGMNMPDAVYEMEVPVFIRQDRSDNFVTNLRKADQRAEDDKMVYSRVQKGEGIVQKRCNARYANVYPFGMNKTAYCDDEYSLKQAKLINYLYETADYSTYKFKSKLALDAIPRDRLLADAEVFWDKLTVALKWSNIYNAYAMKIKLTSLRSMRKLDICDQSCDDRQLSEEEVNELAKVEHNRWNVEKLLMGYRKARNEEDKYEHGEYASELNNNKKLFIHHDIRPFDQLNIIKELDKEFARYIPWIMKMTREND